MWGPIRNTALSSEAYPVQIWAAGTELRKISHRKGLLCLDTDPMMLGKSNCLPSGSPLAAVRR